ncbi:MAG: hypothetical protein ABIZ81_00575 [Opitutaceae bacterium]
MKPISLFGSGWLLAYVSVLVAGRFFTATETITSELPGAMGWIIAVALGFGIVMSLHLLPKALARLLPESGLWCLLAGIASFLAAVVISLAGQKVSIFTLITLVVLSPVAGVVVVGGARYFLQSIKAKSGGAR